MQSDKIRIEYAQSKDGTRISYLAVGQGPGLVIVPGMAQRAIAYQELATLLGAHFTAFVVDRRGRGQSGPQGSDYSIQKEVEDLQAVLKKTGAKLVFGHSYGGCIALNLAREAPKDMLEKLALYEPALNVTRPISGTWVPDFNKALARQDELAALNIFFAGIEMNNGQEFGPEFTHAPFWNTIKAILPTLPAEARAVDALGTVLTRYQTISCPILLLSGGQTSSVITAMVKALSTALPGIHTEILPDEGHNAPDQHPTQVAPLIEAFFAE